ncbi:RNA polymerase subunit sigma-70, partial [Streptomyces sp. NPDC057927]
MRDEERGTRELPAGRVDGLDGPRRAVEGVDGIPEQARPHPEDAQESLSGQDDGQRDPEGAAPSTSSEGRRLVTGGT